MGTSHHRLPGADLDAFGKAGPAGKHLESNRYSPPSAWGFFVCLFGGGCFGFLYYFYFSLAFRRGLEGGDLFFFLCIIFLF